MFLGPIFGAAADRWSRRGCMVVADLLRAAAFVGHRVRRTASRRPLRSPCSPGSARGCSPRPRWPLPSLVAPRGCRRPRRCTARWRTSASRSARRSPPRPARGRDAETSCWSTAATFAVVGAWRSPLRFGGACPARASRAVALMPRGAGGTRAVARHARFRVRDRRVAARAAVRGAVQRGRAAASRPTSSVPATPASRCWRRVFGARRRRRLARGSPGARSRAVSSAATWSGSRSSARASSRRRVAPRLCGGAAASLVAGFGNGLVLVYERLLIQATVARSPDGARLRRPDALDRVGVRDRVRRSRAALRRRRSGRAGCGDASRRGCAGLVVARSAIALRGASTPARGAPRRRATRSAAVELASGRDRRLGWPARPGPRRPRLTIAGGARRSMTAREAVDDLRVELRAGVVAHLGQRRLATHRRAGRGGRWSSRCRRRSRTRCARRAGSRSPPSPSG